MENGLEPGLHAVVVEELEHQLALVDEGGVACSHEVLQGGEVLVEDVDWALGDGLPGRRASTGHVVGLDLDGSARVQDERYAQTRTLVTVDEHSHETSFRLTEVVREARRAIVLRGIVVGKEEILARMTPVLMSLLHGDHSQTSLGADQPVSDLGATQKFGA